MMRKKLSESGALRLQFEIAYWRFGWRLPAALLALVLGLLIWLLWVPVQLSAASRAQTKLESAEREVSGGGAVRMQEPPLHAFRRILLPQAQTTEQLRMIFQLASDAGLTVSQVDMRRQPDAAGAYSQLQIVLPVRGDYLNIKQFLASLLKSMPALAIDQVLLKREQVGVGPVEAQLSLSVLQQASDGGER
jgi:hypothetical protein